MATTIGSKDSSPVYTNSNTPDTVVGESKQEDIAAPPIPNQMPQANQEVTNKALQQQAKEAASMQGLTAKLRNQELQAKLDNKGSQPGQQSIPGNRTVLALSGGPYTVNLPIGSTKQFTPDDLTHSASTGKLAEVQILISYGIDVNAKDSEGMTALMRAAEAGNKEMVELLIDNGAKLDEQNGERKTAVFLAAEKGNAGVIKLLAEKGADLDQGAIDGVRPIMAAAENGKYEAVKALIAGGADAKRTDNQVKTALAYAADGKGDAKIAQALIDAGVPIDKRDKFKQSALMDAASAGNKEVAEVLIRNKAKLDFEDDDKRTALIYAARPANRPMTGKMEIVEMLIKNKANADIKDKDGLNALFYATQVRDIKIPLELVTATKDINIQDKRNKRSPLMEAAQNGHPDVVKELIKKKADLNLQDKDQNTALTSAISNADVEAVRALVDARAKLNMPGADALEAAKSLKQTSSSFQKEADEIIKILEDAQKKSRKTP